MITDQAATLVVKEVTRRLGKQDFLAVAGVSFAIHPGQIFSLLGPNGFVAGRWLVLLVGGVWLGLGVFLNRLAIRLHRRGLRADV